MGAEGVQYDGARIQREREALKSWEGVWELTTQVANWGIENGTGERTDSGVSK